MKKFSSCNSVFNGTDGFELMTIETDISSGLFFFKIIGLADRMVQESRFRILSALRNSGFGIPQRRNEKVTVSLLPAHIKKISNYSDLAIAATYLIASKQIDDFAEPTVLIGQLGLDGSVFCSDDISHLVHVALQNDIRNFVLPKESARHINAIHEINIASIDNLKDIAGLQFKKSISISPQDLIEAENETDRQRSHQEFEIDSLDNIDQHKRALHIALAGRHPILFGGMPGTGKSALARCAIELLDDLSYEQAMEVQSAYLNSNLPRYDSAEEFYRPPIRMPHHHATRISMVGGNTLHHTGEISLAHHGVLLLDELCEFNRDTIESLREIFDHRGAYIRRGNRQSFVAFEGIIIATTNLCPCGSVGVKTESQNSGACRCTPFRIRQYQGKISNPMLDRFHIKTIFHQESFGPYRDKAKKDNKDSTLSGFSMKQSIEAATQRQSLRNPKIGHQGAYLPNAHLSAKYIRSFGIANDALQTINESEKALSIPKRVVTNIFRISRTIADLDEKEEIENAHVMEAIQYARINPFLQ